MTDKEMLEWAARAAALEFSDGRQLNPRVFLVRPAGSASHDDWHGWNPLTDDADAFRLTVKLRMDICFGANYVIVRGSVQMPTVNNANDPYAAARRAIVRAAAEIGKAIKENKE